jgi:peptidoglycan/xylan/chitin deacetylase (PgdA/CDA1 family)
MKTMHGTSILCCILMVSAAFAPAPLNVAALAEGALAPAEHLSASEPPHLTVNSTEEEITNAVAAVRAGRKLTPPRWPNNARVVVCFTVDVDNESLDKDDPLPVPLSNGEYGAITALPRILALLDREQVPATFFIPAMSIMLHPEMIPAIQRSGRNEIGMHGWVHEYWPSEAIDPAVQERAINKTIAYLTRVTGKRPIGVRSPSSALTNDSIAILKRTGFLYDSSMEARDEVYEINSYGKPSGMIEVPMNNIMNDYRYYGADTDGHLMSPDLLFQIYKAEFDGAYKEGSMVNLMLHPHLSGHRSRITQVEKFIDYMKSKPGVWFATMGEVATYAKKTDGHE